MAEQENKSGIMGNIKKHWILYAAGIGGIAVVFFLMRSRSGGAMSADTQNGATTLSTASNVPGQGLIQGASPDTMWQDSLYSMMSGLTSTEAQNYNLLNQIANGTAAGGSGATGSGTSTGAGGTTIGSVPSPWGKNTTGASNNFWDYTTRPGDTLASITSLAHWDAANQPNGGPSFTYNYRNNAAIFSALGVNPNNPNAQVPSGYQVSL